MRHKHTCFLVIAVGESDPENRPTDEDLDTIKEMVTLGTAGMLKVHVINDASVCGRIKLHLTERFMEGKL